MHVSRRGLITGLIALSSAPAIVRAESLMKVVSIDIYDTRCLVQYEVAWDGFSIRVDRRLETMLRPKGHLSYVKEISIAEAKRILPIDAHFAFSMEPPAGIQRHVDMQLSIEQARRLGMLNG